MLKIAIASGKGGVGKSMLSACLSILFSKKRKVIALDCDVDTPNLNIWLGEREERLIKSYKIFGSFLPVIDYKKCDLCGKCVEKCRFSALQIKNNKLKKIEFLCEGCGVCEVVCPKKAIKLKPISNGIVKICKTKYGFFLISAQLEPGKTGSGKIVSKIKEEADKFLVDLQIIDSPPGTGCPVISALQGVNYVILITEPTPSGFSDLKRILEIIKYFKIQWFLVINKWDINKNLSYKIQSWARNRFLGKISYDKGVFKAVSNFTAILETDLKVRKEIRNIFDNLIKRLNP